MQKWNPKTLIGDTVWQNPQIKGQYLFQFCFVCIPQFYSVFGVCLKSQIVCRCAKIVLSQNCRDVENEVFEQSMFGAFLCWRKTSRKEETTRKGQLQKRDKTESVDENAQEYLPKIVGCVSASKKVFLYCPFWFFVWFWFLFLEFLFAFGKRQKGPFVAVRGFFFCSPKSPFFKILLFFLFVFFSVVFPFEIPSLFFLFLHQPLLRKHYCLFCCIFLSCFPFCFLMFAFFRQTTSLQSSFQAQIAFIFGCLVLQLFFCCFWLFCVYVVC